MSPRNLIRVGVTILLAAVVLGIAFFGTRAYLDFGRALEETAVPFGDNAQSKEVQYEDIELRIGTPISVPDFCTSGAGQVQITVQTDAYDTFYRHGFHLTVGEATHFYLLGQPILQECDDGLRMVGRFHDVNGSLRFRRYISPQLSPFIRLETGIEKQFTSVFDQGFRAYGITLGSTIPENPDAFQFTMNTGFTGSGRASFMNMTPLKNGTLIYGFFLIYRTADGESSKAYYAPIQSIQMLP